jgi:hypothetical protein
MLDMDMNVGIRRNALSAGSAKEHSPGREPWVTAMMQKAL